MLAVGAYTWRVEPHWVEVVERDLSIAFLPPALAGKTLIHLSDLHVGPEVADDYLIRQLQAVSALEADVLALTGDFMTCWAGEQLDRATRVLSHLRPARLATLGVLGNHDYGPRWNQFSVADVLTARLRRPGHRHPPQRQAGRSGSPSSVSTTSGVVASCHKTSAEPAARSRLPGAVPQPGCRG